jgi:uncharacterized membrane-anchored protein YhcB (DUF1043 family)
MSEFKEENAIMHWFTSWGIGITVIGTIVGIGIHRIYLSSVPETQKIQNQIFETNPLRVQTLKDQMLSKLSEIEQKTNFIKAISAYDKSSNILVYEAANLTRLRDELKILSGKVATNQVPDTVKTYLSENK